MGKSIGSGNLGTVIFAEMANVVTIYEDANFGGGSKTLAPGGYRFFMPEDFNDVVSSIKDRKSVV